MITMKVIAQSRPFILSENHAAACLVVFNRVVRNVNICFGLRIAERKIIKTILEPNNREPNS